MKHPYSYYVEQGICPRCKKNPIRLGATQCETCLEYNRTNARKHSARKRDDRIMQGICPSCRTNPLADGKARCQSCLDKEAERIEKKRQDYSSTCVCLTCFQNPAVDGKTMCESCLEQSRKYHKEWRGTHPIEEFCSRCRNPTDEIGFSSCSKCRGQQKDQKAEVYHQRKEQSRCVVCGSEIDEDSDSPRICSVCLPASRHRRIKSHSKIRYGGRLEEIIERDKGCVICNLPYGTKIGKMQPQQAVVCHHIDGDVTNNDPANLVMLCYKCHRLAEYWKRLTSDYRQKMLGFLFRHYPILA